MTRADVRAIAPLSPALVASARAAGGLPSAPDERCAMKEKDMDHTADDLIGSNGPGAASTDPAPEPDQVADEPIEPMEPPAFVAVSSTAMARSIWGSATT